MLRLNVMLRMLSLILAMGIPTTAWSARSALDAPTGRKFTVPVMELHEARLACKTEADLLQIIHEPDNQKAYEIARIKGVSQACRTIIGEFALPEFLRWQISYDGQPAECITRVHLAGQQFYLLAPAKVFPVGMTCPD